MQQLLQYLATVSSLLIHNVESFAECRDKNELVAWRNAIAENDPWDESAGENVFEGLY